MTDPTPIKTLAEFREALTSGSGIVITDDATRNHFHTDPEACPGVKEHYFEKKVTLQIWPTRPSVHWPPSSEVSTHEIHCLFSLGLVPVTLAPGVAPMRIAS